MKPSRFSTVFPGKHARGGTRPQASALLAIALSATGLFLSGCSQSEVAQAPVEIKGELIGEEIAAPASPPAADASQSRPATETSAAPAVATASSGLSGGNAPQDRRSPGYAPINFELLSGFEFDGPEFVPEGVPIVGHDGFIPDEIRALNGRQVILQGFMLPLRMEGGVVTEMLLMRDQSMCCYGTIPRVNDWVSVKMTGPGVKMISDEVVTVFGRIHVGTMREQGYLAGIYRMEAERVAGPQDL